MALVARSAEKLARLASELREQGWEARAFPADLRERADIEHMVERVYETYGRIDILINNAGQGLSNSVAEIDVDLYRQIFELNVLGPLQTMQAALVKMRQNGGGLIINVSSMVVAFRLPGNAAYASTKAALNKLSEIARVELASENIRVVVVYPGQTATDFGQHVLGDPAARLKGMGQGQPGGVDSVKFVAEKMLLAAREEPDEMYMHPEWLVSNT